MTHPEAKLMCEREIGELDRIVATTHSYFEESAIDPGIRGTIDFAIEEMFVNMVKYNTGTTSQIEILLARDGDGIRVTMIDRDVERFDPTQRAPVDVDLPAEKRTPGGLGVYLTLKLVDSFSYDYKGRVSTITFSKRPEEQNVRD